MNSLSSSQVLAFLLAAIPGVLIALLADTLTKRRESQNQAQVAGNSRLLLSLEVEGNRQALRQFWTTINNLDNDRKANPTEHLSSMAQAGLLTYAAPSWTTSRWDRLAPHILPVFTTQELKNIDQFYRDLSAIAEAYSRMTTFSPEERPLYQERFWYNRFGDSRSMLFQRMQQTVEHALSMPALAS